MRRSKHLLWIALALAVIGIVGVYYLLRTNLTSQISNERVLYAFTDGKSYRFVLVEPARRLIKVIEAPSKLYDPAVGLTLEFPREAPLFFEKAFSASFNRSYYIDLSGSGAETFARTVLKKPFESLDTTLKGLLERGVEFTDVFTVGSMAKKLRGFSNLDPPGLYNLFNAFSSFGYESFDVKGFTRKPIKIEVMGKVLERIYLTNEEKERVRKEIE